MANLKLYVDGTDNAAAHQFLTLKAALDHVQYEDLTSNLHSSGGPGILEIEISLTTADTTQPTVSVDMVTSATYYCSIYTTAAARHAGVYSTDKYRLETAYDYSCIEIRSNYVRIDGLQVRRTAGSTQNGNAVVNINGQAAANEIRLSNCIIRDDADGTYYNYGVNPQDADVNLVMWNCLVYGGGNASSKGVYIMSAATTKLWNCTIQSLGMGVHNASGTTTAKNTYAAGSGGDAWSNSATLTMTNCGANDTTADGTDPHDSVAYDTSTFVNVTPGSENLHLAGTGSGLYGHGADNTGDTAPLNYTTDIDGDTITGRFDIGADFYTGGAAGQFARPAADRTDGNWKKFLNGVEGNNTDLFSYIDEATTPDDTDSIRSGASPSDDACTIDLSAIQTPAAGTVTMRIRARWM